MPFFFQYENGAPSPKVSELNGYKEYSWEVKNVASKFYDVNTPAWYEDRARVLVSNYKSWEDVVNKYVSLYQLSSNDRKRLDYRVQELFF